jgi:hypothetical protein
MGRHRSIVWGVELSDKKLINMKYTTTFDSRRSTTAHTTTNQKHSAATEGRMEGRCDKRDEWGKRDTIILGAL